MEKQVYKPKLRFPEFSENWEMKILRDITVTKVTNSFSRDNLNYDDGLVKNIHYGDIHTKFTTLFNIEKEIVPFVNKDISISRISDDNYCVEGDLIFADASEDLNDVGKSIEIINLNNQKLLAGLHTILVRPNKNTFINGFAGYLFKSEFVRIQIQKESQGSKVLSISGGRLLNTKLLFPTLPEQTKIASFLTTVDDKLQALKKKKTLLAQYKKGVMQKIFSQEIRFKDDNGNDFPNWEEKKLGDCLDYIQPTKYLVSSSEYDNSYSTPVLTAGKTFILGYTNETNGIFENNLPVIIFDDFTTATQFVDFPFKAKSSAMKILSANEGINIKFIYEAMEVMNYEVGGHERHWISKFAHLDIRVPNHEEQTKIANLLSAIDDKINHCGVQIEKMEVWKKGLLQQMFC